MTADVQVPTRALIQEFKVRHSTPEAILLELPNSSGFGSMTVATLGGDSLAERMMRLFATQATVPATPRRIRDAQGYLTMGLSLPEVWSGVRCLPEAVMQQLCVLFRKQQLVPLGRSLTARVVKASAKGAILTLPNGFTAVAPLERLDVGSSGPSAEARVLDYDIATGGVTVTCDRDTVQRAPRSTTDIVHSAKDLRVGQRVKGRVVLAPREDTGVVVLEIEAPAAATAVKADNKGKKAKGLVEEAAEDSVTKSTLMAYLVRSSPSPLAHLDTVEATIEFLPSTEDLAELCPFIVLTDRQPFEPVPHLRTVIPATRMCGPFPWRDTEHTSKKRGSRDEVEDADKPLRRRRMEEAIDAYERHQDEGVPKSPDEFQKLLLATPNSSYLWTQYMAFHVGLQQYEEARLVAEKAIKTIGVREKQERLNVWIAYMNLENAQGTAESLTAVFRRANQYTGDELAVHEALADIFKASKKTQQLIALCRVMTSKFRNNPKVWQRLGTTFIETDKRDQIKRLIKDMGDALKKGEQCLVVEQLAIFEYRNGNVANGRALFEGLVTKLPKQSDIWSAFIDQEMALITRRSPDASITSLRDVFERVTSLTAFPAKVMQQLLTRYLTFEQAHGTPHGAEHVKEKARAYVESKIAAAGADGNVA